MTNTEAIKTAREALRKQAVFIMEWRDCLVGVQMSADDFASDCGSKEYKQALAALDSLAVEGKQSTGSLDLHNAFSSGWCAGYNAKHVEPDWIDEEFVKWLKHFEPQPVDEQKNGGN